VILHDSRDPAFRQPGGALPAGGTVSLSIRADGAKSATLRMWKDGRERKVPMARFGGDLFRCEADLPKHPGNLWYFFILDYGDHTVYYGNARDLCYGEGACYSHEPPSYQVTLYDPAFEVPSWLRDGMMLQIMPDRFYRSGPPNPEALAPGAYLHGDWFDWPHLNLGLDVLERSGNDFFGGNLRGILEKLPYIEGLGVSAIYLNPIFRSPSNHKYDTANYHEIDPSFGTEADFRALVEAAKARGIRVILDGVFSHIGADSVYFNKYGTYGEKTGAYRDPGSPFWPWFRFRKWPDEYESWWGFRTLPNVEEMEESYRQFINGARGVVAKWLRAGAAGWRLDVADELPMPFLRELRQRAKRVDPDAAIIGEVWEDPTNKISYGEARCYCEGDTLDSAMNYPLREAAFDFLTGKSDATRLARRIEALRESMPKPFFYAMMNLLGSHDKPRAINVLADCGNMQPERRYRFPLELTDEQYARGRRRLIEAWRLVCALPGMPSLYYGDEAGLTGMADPFCRRAYPWGREDKELVERFREIAQKRRASRALRTGGLRLIPEGADALRIERFIEGGADVFGQPAEDEVAVVRIDRSGL